ncbi:MAG: hypothetical protein F2832_09790 [Actinobacteria bacterium]|nr:hypothetical protein [Actinomycetota bacterium]
MSASAAVPELGAPPAAPAARRLTLSPAAISALLVVGLGAALTLVAFQGDGGLQLSRTVPLSIGILIVSGLLCALALLGGRPARRPWGLLPLVLFGAWTALTGASVIWAVDSSTAWVEANRTLMHLGVFAAGVALVRLAPGRWRELLSGVLLAAAAVSFYALLTKVFPGSLAADETYGRLREPFQYWNAVGLMAALGLPPALWLGARREGHAAVTALAYPAVGVLTLTILMAYSRGSLLAAALGLAVWFAVVPLRLRSAMVLLPGLILGLLAGVWTFGQSGLSDDRVGLPLRSNAGTELGILLGALILVLLVTGILATWQRERTPRPERVRRAWGIALLTALALIPVLALGALSTSDRGLSGSVSKGWRDLTDPNAPSPANDPSRLTAVGSVRSRYWRDAFVIASHDKALGVGAGGYATARVRVRKDDLDVLHAHGFAVQTVADLGYIGLALALALLAAWLAAAYVTTGPWRGRGARPEHDERFGMVALGCVVIVFGVHSFIDWTWFIPGTVVPALLCAGWLAGRGPTLETFPADGGLRARLRTFGRQPVRVAAAAAVLIIAIAGAWSTAQPLRSTNQVDDALSALAAGRIAQARTLALKAGDTDPLSVEPLFVLATVEGAAGDTAAQRRALVNATEVQPESATAWRQLAEFDLSAGRTAAALREISAALYLDPRSPQARAIFLAAYRAARARR